MKKVYQYEVGILLDKNDKEYEAYSMVYDRKHGYYNEDWSVELNLKELKDYVRYLVERGKDKTYGIISAVQVTEEEYKDIKKNIKDNDGYYDTTDFDFDYSLDSIVYSLYKEKENVIVKNFIEKGSV